MSNAECEGGKMDTQCLAAHVSISIYVLATWIALSIASTRADEAAASPSVKRGEQLFVQSCASCHDVHSRNRTVGPGLKGYSAKYDRSAQDKAARNAILNGRGSMPAFSSLSSPEVDDLISYLRTL